MFTRLTRGVWANPSHPYFTVYSCVPKLLGDEQGYISFLTALHLHGVISQIPNTVQVATTGHSRSLTTPIGKFEFFQLKPQLFHYGIEQSEAYAPYFIATVEKALFDILYIATRKSKRFRYLPELEIDSDTFNRKTFKKILNQAACASNIHKAIAANAKQLGLIDG